MIEKKVIRTAPEGLHMRLAMKLIDKIQNYKSKVILIKDKIKADATSILEVTMLAALQGEEILIKAEGIDEKKVVNAICQLNFLSESVETYLK